MLTVLSIWVALLVAAVVAVAVVVVVQLNRRATRLLDEARNTEAKRARSAKRAATYPQHYPDGWYRLLDSNELKIGQTREVEALGELFAVFRGEDGKVGVLEAYCPHLGANLTQGGKVVGNCIQCPFHLWKFDTAGTCKEIPYSETIPASAKTFSWPVTETYGLIFIYYSNKRETEPAYPIPPIFDESYTKHGEFSAEVSMHLQEFAENSVDFQHFQPLHGQMKWPFTNFTLPGVSIVHNANWQNDERKYIAYFHDEAYLKFFGRDLKKYTSLKAVITFVGPGGLVYFSFFTDFGVVVLIQTHTPTTYSHLKVKFHWFAPKSVPRFLVWYVCGSWITQWQADVQIWENKIYRPKPLLVKGDGPVMKLRQWYQQFYPPKSDSLDW